MHKNRRPVFLALSLVSLAAFLASCEFMQKLDPLYCGESDAPVTLTLEAFRASQTNQTVDNTVPLLRARAVGLRADLTADVEEGVKRTVTMEMHRVTAADERSLLKSQEFDCVRSAMAMTHHLDAGELQDGDRVEFRVLDHTGALLDEASVEPRFISGTPFSLVFVPLGLNDEQAEFEESDAESMSRAAHELFPTDLGYVFRERLDLGDIEEEGVERSYEALARLREVANGWRSAGELPELAVVIGVLPTFSGTSWGVGGGSHGVTINSMSMFLHEVGHAVGAPHADGCGAPAPLEGTTTQVLPLGFNHVQRTWHGGNDMMSYCHPRNWIGAPLYERVMEYFERAQLHGHTLQILTLPDR